jgi:hypothetical protein
MEEHPVQCPRQQELVAETQGYLMQLSELARREADAIQSRDEQEILAIDKEIEATLGNKERTLGALYEHRAEHGC